MRRFSFLLLFSLLSVLSTQGFSSERQIDDLYEKAWSLLFNNPDSAIHIASEQKSMSIKESYEEGIIKAYYVIGYGNYLKSNYEIAARNYLAGLEYVSGSSSESNNRKEMLLLQAMGVLNVKTKRYPESSEYFLKALKIAIDIDEKQYIASLTYNLGVSNYYHQEYEEANQYFHKSLSYYEGLNQVSDVAKVVNSIGNVYNLTNRLDEAEKKYNEALSLISIEKNPELALTYISNLGENNKKRNQLVKSEKNYIKAVEIALNHNINSKLPWLYNNLGDLKIVNGKYQEAIKHYNNSIEHIDLNKYDIENIRALKGVVECHESLNQNDSLPKYLTLILEQKELLLESNANIHTENLKYQLMVADLKHEQKDFTDQISTFRVILSVAGLLFLIGMFKYLRFKIRQRRILKEAERL